MVRYLVCQSIYFHAWCWDSVPGTESYHVRKRMRCTWYLACLAIVVLVGPNHVLCKRPAIDKTVVCRKGLHMSAGGTEPMAGSPSPS